MALNHGEEEPVMKITRVGLDIAKQVFQVHGVDERGGIAVVADGWRGRRCWSSSRSSRHA